MRKRYVLSQVMQEGTSRAEENLAVFPVPYASNHTDTTLITILLIHWEY